MNWLAWAKCSYRLYRLDHLGPDAKRMVWQALCRTRFVGDGALWRLFSKSLSGDHV